VRGSSLGLGMSQYLVDQIESIPNIRVCTNMDILGVEGEGHLERIRAIDRASGLEQLIEATGMFIFIGAAPHTEIFHDFLALDSAGFILTGPDLMLYGERPKGWPLKRDPYLLETSLPGVFAAGDVRHHSVKRVASAVGEGAVTIQFVHQYLKTV
jgi:thioredoxin reductase (NADPH)